MKSDWERAYDFLAAFPAGTVFDQAMLATLIGDVRRETKRDIRIGLVAPHDPADDFGPCD